MDLLLYLIDKEQVDIYDIPISRITDQFIKHIEVMQIINLEQAGEFIAMAATLMVIKMKMLMPSRQETEDPEEEDPRAELVRRLLEYKRFKEAARPCIQRGGAAPTITCARPGSPYQDGLEPGAAIADRNVRSAFRPGRDLRPAAGDAGATTWSGSPTPSRRRCP